MDFTQLEPASDGRENVLVLSDVFIKFTVAVPTRDQQASTVVKTLGRDTFLDTASLSESIPTRADVLRHKWSKTFARVALRKPGVHPTVQRETGNVRCLTGPCTTLLLNIPANKKRKRPEHLKEVCYAYHATPHFTTGYSPHYLLFATDPKLPVEVLLPRDQDSPPTNDGERLTKHQKRLREVHQHSQDKVRADAILRKQQCDRSKQVKPDELPIGERVFT